MFMQKPESLFIAYLNLSFSISTFDKNYRCLEELIKITYNFPINYKPILAYFNKEKFIKKCLCRSLRVYL